MNFITSKVLMIAIGIIATLAIASSVIMLLGYVLDIYSSISKIDYNLMTSMDDYSRFNVTSYNVEKYDSLGEVEFTSKETLSGIEVLNMISKYKYDDTIYINEKNAKNDKVEMFENLKNTDAQLRQNYYCAITERTEEKIKIQYKIAN